jgi:hypothetical protein
METPETSGPGTPETPASETPAAEGPTQRMQGEGGAPPPGTYVFAPMSNWPTGARLPIPGNAEWALWFFVEIVFAIIWAASDTVDAAAFTQLTAIVTFAYLISRGIAKASRVLEQ